MIGRAVGRAVGRTTTARAPERDARGRPTRRDAGASTRVAASRRVDAAMRATTGDDVARAALDRANFARMSPRARHAALLDAHDRFHGKDARRNRGEALRDAAYASGDGDALRREHRFVRDDDEDARRADAWAVRLAKRYHEKLYKAYAVFDATTRRGETGARWRTAAEVRAGKGQFTCGEKRCDASDGLASFECVFAYVEGGVRKRAMMKVRACARCAEKLGAGGGVSRAKPKDGKREKKDRKRKRDAEKDDAREALRGLLEM